MGYLQSPDQLAECIQLRGLSDPESLRITGPGVIAPAPADANRQRPDMSLTVQYLKPGRRAMIAILTLIGGVAFNNHESCAQMGAQDKPPFAYFLDRVPDSLDGSTLPKTARYVVVARVRIEGRLTYLVGRDQSGSPPPLQPYLFYAGLEIMEVRKGNATVGATVDVTFGVPGSPARIHYPHTPHQLARDYDVVIYSGDDNERHLAGLPISETQY